MDTKRIYKFLSNIATHNNREWMQEHKAEYQYCKDEFEKGVAELIGKISEFDPEIAHLTPKDCIYRFNRDIRFSQDKSPYKRHFGAYICAHGKKSLRGGYSIHLQPGRSFVSIGCYWLPTNILTSCRNEIMGNIDEWLKAVNNGEFIHTFGYPGEGVFVDDGELSDKGFGLHLLKTAPRDFPKDYEYLDYLRMKDYAVWHRVEDSFFSKDNWMQEAIKIFKVGKPMMDFTNSVIDDYE